MMESNLEQRLSAFICGLSRRRLGVGGFVFLFAFIRVHSRLTFAAIRIVEGGLGMRPLCGYLVEKTRSVVVEPPGFTAPTTRS